MNRAGGPLLILCADIMGDHNTLADGHSVEKSDEKENKVSGAGHSGKGRAPHKISDNQRIDRIVKLLEKIAYYQRQGVPDHLLLHRSGCQKILLTRTHTACCLPCSLRHDLSLHSYIILLPPARAGNNYLRPRPRKE